MKFFFPDSQDQVDPSFDFKTEERSELRLTHRDDHYAHEEFERTPFDGILLSMAMVESGRYTLPQKHRLYRMGIRRFFRIDSQLLETMGDCGAFSYVREDKPPYSVGQVINFYDELGIDYGISVDHVILGFDPRVDEGSIPKGWKERQEITLELAEEFLKEHKKSGSRFTCAWRIVISQAKQGMSQCYIRSLHAVHFKGALNSGEAHGQNDAVLVHAQVPLAELWGYANAIRSLGRGRANYSMIPSHFEREPDAFAVKIVKASSK